MTPPKAKVVHYTDVPPVTVGPEAPGATLRWVIDEEHDGAPHYALRVVEVAPGGHTPDHTHPFEHENFVIEGRGRVQIEGEWHELKPGDVVFVPAGIRHTYMNASEAPFKFLCGIPVSRLIETG
jgi:quercetin dioxygenase-like cupin family protein